MTEEALARQMKAAFRAAAAAPPRPPPLRQRLLRGLKLLRARVVDTMDLAAVKVAATKAPRAEKGN